jgi:tRNA A-37 threonylcarbamoyl transferase component Bud32
VRLDDGGAAVCVHGGAGEYARTVLTPSPDDLELAEVIGSGAIATVRKVRDRASGRTYAGKVLHERHQRDGTAAQRFVREAELAARLAHPNVVGVYGIVAIDGQPVLLMELVEGDSLAVHVARHAPLSEAQIVALARDVAAGLTAAHDVGVIHRDLKPANVLLAGEGEGLIAKIADFGMARASALAGVDPRSFTALGTPDYMAPEALDPLAVDARTDLYALGCMIFEMALGYPPYAGATPFAILQAHRDTPVPAIEGAYSSALKGLVAALLAKAPGQRPQSARAVVQALDALAQRSARERDAAPGVALASREIPALPGIAPLSVTPSGGTCPRCGAALLREVAVCFGCGSPQMIPRPGPWVLLVTGPGKVAAKIGAQRRDRLLEWLQANPSLGLDPSRLTKDVPRLPFVLAEGLSEGSARALAQALTWLGFETEIVFARPVSSAPMRRKMGKLAARNLTPVLVVGGALSFLAGPFAFIACVPLLPFAAAVGAVRAVWRPVRRGETPTSSLPERTRSRIERLREQVPRIEAARHRDALRAVTRRVLDIHARVLGVEGASHGTPGDEKLHAELDRALDVATVAAVRLDELDRELARPDFDPSQAEDRDTLRERDVWATRLLQLIAHLDAFAIRLAQARTARGHDELRDELGAVAASVEAIETL